MKPARAVSAILVSLALLGCSGGTRESRSEALLRVQPANAKLGDVVFAVLCVRTVDQADAKFPETIECSEGLEVLRSAAVSPRRIEDGRMEQLRRYEIQCWRIGKAHVGPAKVELGASGSAAPKARRDVLEAAGIEFLVRAVAEDAAATDIRDIKGPAKPAKNEALALQLIGLALLALLGGLAYVVLRRKPRVERKPTAPGIIESWEATLSAFDEMEKEDLAAQGAEVFYGRLTAIMRRYIRDRFGPPAEQMTSEELVSTLEMLDEIDPSGRALLQELLKKADGVKFAQGSDRDEEKMEFLARVREFVAQTIRRDAVAAGVRT